MSEFLIHNTTIEPSELANSADLPMFNASHLQSTPINRNLFLAPPGSILE